MVEHDIAVVIGELFAAGLHWAIQNLIHPLDVAVRADDGGEVLQRSLQRIVQAGDHQQKHEEGQNVQFALDQQRCAREGGSGDAQPQNKPGGHHEDGRSQLALDEAALHSADFLFQPGKISTFGVVGAQVGHRFDALLNAVLAGNLCRCRFAGKPFLHAGRQRDDGKRHRQRPDGGKRHAPVEKQHRHGDDRGGEHRAIQRRDKVGLALLQHGAVVHNGGGQVGEILLSKKRQWNLPQLLRKPHPAHAGFHIGDKERVVVFKPRADHDEQRRRNAADGIERDSLRRQRTAHDVAHQQVQEPHRQHEGDVLQRTAQHALDVVHRALAGEGIAPL